MSKLDDILNDADWTEAMEQPQLLEWVEQELPLKMSLTSPSTNNWGAGFNEALNQTHQILKNKLADSEDVTNPPKPAGLKEDRNG